MNHHGNHPSPWRPYTTVTIRLHDNVSINDDDWGVARSIALQSRCKQFYDAVVKLVEVYAKHNKGNKIPFFISYRVILFSRVGPVYRDSGIFHGKRIS